MMVLGDVQDFTKQYMYYTQWFVKIINNVQHSLGK